MLQGGAREVWRRTIAIQKRKLKVIYYRFKKMPKEMVFKR